MTAGDRVFCKHRFKVSSYDDDIMTISIRPTAEEYDYIRIPMYISGLGFYMPERDFCIPGSYLPVDHPDYYRHIEDTDTIMYNGQQYKLSFGEDFYKNGQYILTSQVSARIIRYARLRTAKDRRLALDSLVGSSCNGEELDAIILFMFAKHADTREFDHEFGLKYQFTLAVYDPQTKYYAYLQDVGTGVEYEFPLKYLTIRH